MAEDRNTISTVSQVERWLARIIILTASIISQVLIIFIDRSSIVCNLDINLIRIILLIFIDAMILSFWI
ncbi:MAG: hypothetical protein Tsb0014_22130 [Pleurocapsa sp.]